MDVTVTLEHRFERTPDGAVWTRTGSAYSFWTRYLDVFNHVNVVARVQDVASVPPHAKRADGEGVSFASVPYYVGPWQYLKKMQSISSMMRKAALPENAVILRVGSQIAACLQATLREAHHPYGLEVVSDPYDVFSPGAVKHPLRPFFRWWFVSQLRQQCAGACAIAYVTEHSLQRRYPPPPNALSTHYSSVELPDLAFVATPRPPVLDQQQFTLITVGTLAQLYKAPDVLIDAVAICVQEGLDLQLVIVGDGVHRAELEAQARALNLGDRVCFYGELPAGEAVRSYLDRADVFVLPSRQEGLPRAMIEAMARGLPCIGSTVGGIPELLTAETMVPPNRADLLAQKIREITTDTNRMADLSAHSLRMAQQYQEDILQARRINFYRYIQTQTDQWLRQQKSYTDEQALLPL